jgi:ABC-type Mn2+/Zn2+ transport system permease subunit
MYIMGQMENIAIWVVGCSLMAIAGALYVLTWRKVVRRPAILIGSITTLWFRSLVYVLIGGIILNILWAVNKILWTFLYWRH